MNQDGTLNPADDRVLEVVTTFEATGVRRTTTLLGSDDAPHESFTPYDGNTAQTAVGSGRLTATPRCPAPPMAM